MATHQQDQLTVVNPTDQAFTVHWAKNPYTLEAGRQVIWPRFIAEHFAKHLADSILLKREEEARATYKAGGRPMSEFIAPALLNSRQERPKVIDTIIKGVYTYYTPQNGDGRAAEIQREIDSWNKPQPDQPQERVADMGNATDPLLGELQDNDEDEVTPPATPHLVPPPMPAAPTTANVQNALGTTQPGATTPGPQSAPVSASTPPATPAGETGIQKRNRLVKEAKQLGLKITPGVTSDALEAEIKKQYA